MKTLEVVSDRAPTYPPAQSVIKDGTGEVPGGLRVAKKTSTHSLLLLSTTVIGTNVKPMTQTEE